MVHNHSMHPVTCMSILLAACLAAGTAARAADTPDPLKWPGATRESRPWTRWWWLGSAVDKENLTAQLEQLHAAGLGGVEICPIYGAKGYESRYIDFLSPKWMEMLAHTTAEAKRLDMGVDLTTGTGWPFGGPGISEAEASSKVVLQQYKLRGGGRLGEKLPPGTLEALVAVSDAGQRIDLTGEVKEGRLGWTAPEGNWKLYALLRRGPVQKVKRAAPGGEGNVVDPYSVAALEKYLAGFDRAFSGYHGSMPRAHFHDSFEYYGASWTPSFLPEFQKRRGYDLRAQLPALLGDGPVDLVARVKCDYRETLSDLHLDYIQRWTAWAHQHGGLSRNQAHGAPGNLLDLYSAADIPETEIFREPEEPHLPMLMFASSAAHVSGRNLASAESFTWLGEHFQTPLSKLKSAADFLFLSGINHLLFHGTPYSPKDAGWPGWLFYASVHFGPNGGLWRDLPAFNGYLTRCQSVLQAGKPDNDVLLYFPVHDLWQKPDGLVTQFAMPGRFLEGTPFHDAAMTLWKRGYTFDQVSDRLLANARVEGGRIVLGGGRYRAVIVPKARLVPPATLQRLIDLADTGGRVVFWGGLPRDVPGFGGRENGLRQLVDLQGKIIGRDLPEQADSLLVGEDLDQMLERLRIPREPMADLGLRFVRRSHDGGHHYFIVNRSERAVEGWVSLAATVKSAVLLDPRFENKTGVAATRQGEGGAEVYLQLQPGESCILRTFTDKQVTGRGWVYTGLSSEAKPVSGRWRVHFVDGGPALPADFQTDRLASWTELGDAEARRFAGAARYTLEFDAPSAKAGDWLLDLGRVCESARVKLNGHDLGTLWSEPFQVPVGSTLRRGRNVLEVEVTNLAANRIADLDRRHVDWKSFHEINFVNRDYKPFDASAWPLRDSGLLGPVRLVPLTRIRPGAGVR